MAIEPSRQSPIAAGSIGGGRELAVLFPPWHGGGKFYEKLISRLVDRGDSALAYYFHDDILKPDMEQTRASFHHIRDTISAELDGVVAGKSYERVKLIGVSLGNPALSIVTSKFHDFDAATFVCSASSLARSMWHGIRTQHIRAGIESAGNSLEDVEHSWQEMAPARQVGALAGKQVTALVSTSDQIIPTRFQQEFVDAASRVDVDLTVRASRLGHYATCARFFYYGELA